MSVLATTAGAGGAMEPLAVLSAMESSVPLVMATAESSWSLKDSTSSGRSSASTSIKTVALVLPAAIVTWPCETPTKSLPATAVPSIVE